MSQATLDDDLFDEAAQEMRADVEESLAAARAELPEAEEVWAAEADNVLGVLNGLRSALDAGEATEHLRQAKKWYAVGERADAFADPEDLAAEIEAVEDLLDQLADAAEEVGALASTVPDLRSVLEEMHSGDTVAEETDAAGEADLDADEADPEADPAEEAEAAE